jgi:hypothetical protein
MGLTGTGTPGAGIIGAIVLSGPPISIIVAVVGAISNRPDRTPVLSPPLRDLWKRAEGIVNPRSALDLSSISWILRTSLNDTIRLSALQYLVSIPELPKFDSALVANCFHVFIGSSSLSNGKVVVGQGLEQLAAISARCFFRTFHHLSVTDPTSTFLGELRRCYNRVFPLETDFGGHPFHCPMAMIHILIKQYLNPEPVEWDNEELSIQERIPLAWYMAGAAEVGFKETEHKKKVPRWILRFALKSLSLDPPLPSSVVANCLKIIAIDLDCDLSAITTLNERYV